MGRLVVHFSCGAASAVAAKLALEEDSNAVIVNAFVQEEHEDNRRFLADVETWLGTKIVVLRDTKYDASTLEVWRRRRYMKGLSGAPCSKALKRDLLDSLWQPGDIDVMGYTKGEEHRLERYFNAKSDHLPRAPLIERGITKDDCYAIIMQAGLQLPAMYRMGYHNANCIGCVKGGIGYWNKIKADFPERFESIAQIQDSIGSGAYFLQHRSGPLKGQRFSLREIPPNAGRHKDLEFSCGFACEAEEV